jgi:hypothetical protein
VTPVFTLVVRTCSWILNWIRTRIRNTEFTDSDPGGQFTTDPPNLDPDPQHCYPVDAKKSAGCENVFLKKLVDIITKRLFT